jgi:hypothetical protein
MLIAQGGEGGIKRHFSVVVVVVVIVVVVDIDISRMYRSKLPLLQGSTDTIGACNILAMSTFQAGDVLAMDTLQAGNVISMSIMEP